MSRYRDPQLKVTENVCGLRNLGPNIYSKVDPRTVRAGVLALIWGAVSPLFLTSLVRALVRVKIFVMAVDS